MPNDQKLQNDWLENPPPEGDEGQWFKERSQNNRQAKFRLRRRRD